MDEEVKQDTEDAVIKAIREEYEKKLDEQRKELSEEKERALAEQNYEQAVTDSLKKRFRLN